MGVNEGQIIDCDLNRIADHILLLLESSCFQVAFLDTFDMQLSKQLIGTYLDFYRLRNNFV